MIKPSQKITDHGYDLLVPLREDVDPVTRLDGEDLERVFPFLRTATI